MEDRIKPVYTFEENLTYSELIEKYGLKNVVHLSDQGTIDQIQKYFLGLKEQNNTLQGKIMSFRSKLKTILSFEAKSAASVARVINQYDKRFGLSAQRSGGTVG